MFLYMLNEKERKNFLELAHIAVELKGGDDKEEYNVWKSFKREVELDDYEMVNKTIEELVTAFNSSTKKIKRAVIIELAGVLDADEVIEEKEKDWIKKLGNDLGFREAELKKLVRWTQDFNDLLKEGYEYINKRG
ncbi:MAG: hypothetical protein IJU00_00825 [Selenomonas sp.]|nr:hypothetical protein [Selenomonas sp.]